MGLSEGRARIRTEEGARGRQGDGPPRHVRGPGQDVGGRTGRPGRRQRGGKLAARVDVGVTAVGICRVGQLCMCERHLCSMNRCRQERPGRSEESASRCLLLLLGERKRPQDRDQAASRKVRDLARAQGRVADKPLRSAQVAVLTSSGRRSESSSRLQANPAGSGRPQASQFFAQPTRRSRVVQQPESGCDTFVHRSISSRLDSVRGLGDDDHEFRSALVFYPSRSRRKLPRPLGARCCSRCRAQSLYQSQIGR